MNIGIYLYDGYYEVELAVLTMILKNHNVLYLSSDQNEITCMDGKRIVIDKKLDSIDADLIDALIIPGGNPIIKDDILNLIRACFSKNKIIGGICGGVDYIAHSGILENLTYTGTYSKDKTYSHLPSNPPTYNLYETDKNVVTSRHDGYLEFAMEIGRLLGEVDYETVSFLNTWFKSPCKFKHVFND